MSKTNYLTREEQTLLLRLAEAYKSRNVTSWVLAVAGGGGSLLPSDGQGQENPEDVPTSDSFYFGLEAKEFLSLARSSGGFLQLSIQKPTLDYAGYATKNRPGRWWEDIRYALEEEKRAWAKLAWIALGYGLAILSAILLRLLGWIKIGN